MHSGWFSKEMNAQLLDRKRIRGTSGHREKLRMNLDLEISSARNEGYSRYRMEER